jgi:hypothetical protein
LSVKDFAPFLVFFITLFSLMKFLPGKPWIVPIAFVGCIYGGVMAAIYPEDPANPDAWTPCPVLLRDEYK